MLDSDLRDFVYSPLVANIDTESNSASVVASFLVPGNLGSQVTSTFQAHQRASTKTQNINLSSTPDLFQSLEIKVSSLVASLTPPRIFSL